MVSNESMDATSRRGSLQSVQVKELQLSIKLPQLLPLERYI